MAEHVKKTAGTDAEKQKKSEDKKEEHKHEEEKQLPPKQIESGLAALVKMGMDLQEEFLKDPEAAGNSDDFELKTKALERAAKDFKNKYHLEKGQKIVAKYMKNLAEELND